MGVYPKGYKMFQRKESCDKAIQDTHTRAQIINRHICFVGVNNHDYEEEPRLLPHKVSRRKVDGNCGFQGVLALLCTKVEVNGSVPEPYRDKTAKASDP